MLFASLVVEQGPVLREVGDHRGVDVPAVSSNRGSELEHVQSDSRVPVCVPRNAVQRIAVGRQPEVAETPVTIIQRAPENRDDSRGLERLEDVDLRPREQC